MKIKYLTCTAILFAASSFLNIANASLTTLSFNDGDSLIDWEKDRTVPTGFEIINNELVMTVSGALIPGSNGFYNTHGMQLDIGESNYISVDMFIDSNWDASGRYAGLWAVANEENGDRADEYPILEFQNNYNGETGVAKWDSNVGWVVPPSSLFTYDAFNKLEIKLVDNLYEYFVNGNLVHTAASTGAYLGSVILNGYNSMSTDVQGQGYQVRYDNLTYGTIDVSEPATLAILALTLVGFGARRFRKN